MTREAAERCTILRGLVGSTAHGLNVHRPELEEMYGFDTKYAMHMLRLGYQGVELLTT